MVTGNKDDYEKCVVEAQKAWKSWAQVTAPQRGLIFEIFKNYQTFFMNAKILKEISIHNAKWTSAGDFSKFFNVHN